MSNPVVCVAVEPFSEGRPTAGEENLNLKVMTAHLSFISHNLE